MFNRVRYAFVLSLCVLAGPLVNAWAPSPEPGDKPKEASPVTVSLSKEGLTINGTHVQLGKTTKADLEKLLGPLERTVTPELQVQPIGFWDSKGVRVYFRKGTGAIQYLDLVHIPSDVLPELECKKPFAGVLRVDGVQISKKTTKAALEGKVTGKLFDHSFNLPGFSIAYPHHRVSFELTEDRKALQFVRIERRP
jgi:hypothetical protein